MRSVDRVFKFIDLPSEEPLPARSGGKGGKGPDLVIDNPHAKELWPTRGQMDIRGLTVKYTAAGRQVLSDVSFSVDGGQSVSVPPPAAASCAGSAHSEHCELLPLSACRGGQEGGAAVAAFQVDVGRCREGSGCWFLLKPPVKYPVDAHRTHQLVLPLTGSAGSRLCS